MSSASRRIYAYSRTKGANRHQSTDFCKDSYGMTSATYPRVRFYNSWPFLLDFDLDFLGADAAETICDFKFYQIGT